MPKHDLPQLPHLLRDLETWAATAGVADLLDLHISEISAFLDNDVTRHRLSMAPASATVREIVVNGNTTKAFLSRDALASLGNAACSLLIYRAQRRFLDVWRDEHWQRPLPNPALSDLVERVKAQMERWRSNHDLWSPVMYKKAEKEVVESPDQYRIKFFGIGRGAFGWREPVTSRVHLEGEGPGLKAACTCSRNMYDDQPCVHLRVAAEWLLDAIYDSRDPDHRYIVQLLSEPRWTRVLNALERAVPAAADTEPNERLVWKVAVTDGSLIVEPAIQKIMKRGGWSSGRQVSGSDLWDLQKSSDSGQRRAIRTYVDSGSEPDGAEVGMGYVLELLVGNTLVFDYESPNRRLEVVAEPPSVSLRRVRGDELSIGVPVNGSVLSGDSLEECRVSWRHLAQVDAQHGICAVIRVPRQCADLLSVLARYSEQGFPASGLDRILEVLSKYGEWLPVDLDPGLAVVTRATDATPLVRLRPVGAGGLEALILMASDLWSTPMVPGEGARTRLLVEEGHVIQLQRNPNREQDLADEVVNRFALSSYVVSPYSFRIADPERALDFLLALRDNGDDLTVEWPDDSQQTRVSRAQSDTLRVRLESRGRIFGLDGDVEIDGEKVPLAELLAAMGRGERWIRLGPGRFARIEAKLREKLQATETISMSDGRGGNTIAAAVAPHLGEWLGDDVAVDGDRAYGNLLGRVRTAENNEPEVPTGLACELRPYQVEGFRWLSRLGSWGAGAILADEMGLGKTVQTLAVLLERAPIGPALVVAPTSVCAGWLSEAGRFAPELAVKPYRGADRRLLLADLGPGDVLVTSYTIAALDADDLAEHRFASLIIDEAQFVKNPGTRRAKALRRFQTDWALALTGTPLENHLGELWAIFNTVSPGLLGSWKHFRDRFAAPVERHSDDSALQALVRQTRPFLLRRTKSEVAPELPPRTEVVKPVVLKRRERELYEAVRRQVLDTYVAGADEGQRFELLAAITRLRLLSCHPRLADPSSTALSAKLEAALELLDELLADGQRALVFSQFTRHLALIREALDQRKVSYLYLDGSTPAAQRGRLVKAWENEEHKLFLLSMKAGGTGLNLMGADLVIHLDPWWNPAVEDQATDRTHRIGQTRPVTVVRLISQATIEEAVVELHETKRELARGVLEGAQAAAALSTDELVDLIKVGSGGEGMLIGDDDEGIASYSDAVVRQELTESPIPSSGGESIDLEGLLGLVSDFQSHLEAELREGKIVSNGTVKIYSRAAERFVEFVTALLSSGTSPVTFDEWAALYQEALSNGTFKAPKSESTISRTVLNRIKRMPDKAR